MEAKNPAIETLRLHIRDKFSNCYLLVNTGADISVIPKPTNWHYQSFGFELHAGNGSTNKTYGTQRCQIYVGIPYVISWNFIFDDITHAILGADVLAHYKLLPHLYKR